MINICRAAPLIQYLYFTGLSKLEVRLALKKHAGPCYLEAACGGSLRLSGFIPLSLETVLVNMPFLSSVRSCTTQFDNVPKQQCLSLFLASSSTLQRFTRAHSWVKDMGVGMDVLAPVGKCGSLVHFWIHSEHSCNVLELSGLCMHMHMPGVELSGFLKFAGVNL